MFPYRYKGCPILDFQAAEKAVICRLTLDQALAVFYWRSLAQRAFWGCDIFLRAAAVSFRFFLVCAWRPECPSNFPSAAIAFSRRRTSFCERLRAARKPSITWARLTMLLLSSRMRLSS